MEDPRRRLGARGEEIAARQLEARGYEIVDRNFRTRHGELDIVAADERCLVFCEVKTRIVRAGAPIGPLASVGARKRRQVRQMAREWLGSRAGAVAGRSGGLAGRPAELRFDAIGIGLDRDGGVVSFEHLEGAF